MFVNFNILNQLGSPAINSNTFANRPAAGQTGRLFVSTDTFEIYRDNGTGWDLIGGPGSSTVTGSGATGQVTYWTGTNTVSGENALFWDAAQNHLGINTATPGVALDIHSAADVALQLNGTGATPSIFQQFLSASVAQYEMGYNWNVSADYRRFSIYDVQGAKEVISIDQQSRRVGINFQYTSLTDQPQYTLDVDGSIRGQNLYVTSNSEDTLISNTKPVGGAGQNVFFGNGGANVVFTTVDTGSYNTGIGWGALSLLTTGYRNVAIGQVALEQLTTGYNNTALGDNSGRFYTGPLPLTNANQCIFIGRNAQASADNITNEIVIGAESTGLGSNSVTLGNASITKTYLRGEVLVNTTTDVGAYNLQVNGAGYFSGNSTQFGSGTGSGIIVNISGTNNTAKSSGTFWADTATVLSMQNKSTTLNTVAGLSFQMGAGNAIAAVAGYLESANQAALAFFTGGLGTVAEKMAITSGGNVLINTTTDAGQKLQVNGTGFFNNTLTANDNIILVAGEFYYGNNTTNQFARTYVSGTSGSATLNFAFWNGSIWGIKSSIDYNGKATFTDSITTGAPNTGTSAAWKLGSRVAATVVVNTTEYIEVDIGGTLYKLATVT